MSPQDIYRHGMVNGEIFQVLYHRVKQTGLGRILQGQTLLSCPDADLSAEPDIIFVSFESMRSGRTRRVAKANDESRSVEFEGSADLVIETVSDSSVRKDTVLLPVSYYRANVTEFWLVDARGEELLFQINHRGPIAYEPVPVDAEGYQYSDVLECSYRLERYRDQDGDWAYDLKEKPAKDGGS